MNVFAGCLSGSDQWTPFIAREHRVFAFDVSGCHGATYFDLRRVRVDFLWQTISLIFMNVGHFLRQTISLIV